MKWLYDGLEETLASMDASTEREHILMLLRKAQPIRLSDGLTSAVADTISTDCSSIATNLDSFHMPFDCVWFEYNHSTRTSSYEGVEGKPLIVGSLIASNPAHEGHFVIFVAWQLEDGRIFHSYALLNWDRSILFDIASLSFGSDHKKAADKILEAAYISLPQGLRSEMEIWQLGITDNQGAIPAPLRLGDKTEEWQNDINKAVLQTKKDVLGEHLFLLTTLLMLATPAVKLERVTVDNEEASEIEQHGVAQTQEQEEDWGDSILTIGERTRFEALLKPPTSNFWKKKGFHNSFFGKRLLWNSPLIIS